MSSPSDNEESSQDGIDAIDHVRRAEEILAAVRPAIKHMLFFMLISIQSKRKKEAKLKAIEKEYRQRVGKAHTSFQNFFDAHKAKVLEAQEAHFRRLNRALHKRQNTEIDIWKQLKAIEKSRRALANLVVEVYNARLETTAEISTTGRVPEKTPKLRRPEEKLPTDIPLDIAIHTLLYLLTGHFWV
ncbi:hypothetical protein V492_07436 [Pseudogymnoascus sp. VKM F-4246]|nr:hypothetical protein V492_07436 [Pseudogymnoascus sp. VKM F-4246]